MGYDPLCIIAYRDFTRRARNNLTKWGLQDPETIALAIAEESGEVAQAVLQARYGTKDVGHLYDETINLGALCFQMAVVHFRVPSLDTLI